MSLKTITGLNPTKEYQFLRESATKLNAGLPPQLAFFSAVASVNLVPLPPCHDLLQAAVSNAHLDDFGKSQLICQLQEAATGLYQFKVMPFGLLCREILWVTLKTSLPLVLLW